MTVARNSQLAAEVLRSNTAVLARTSQLVAETLRTNNNTVVRASQLAVEVLRPQEGPMTDAQLIAWLKSGTAKRRILMEVGVLSGGSEVTRYLSDRGYITGSTETPASTTYTPVISGGVKFTESISLTGEASLSAGTIEFNNINGEIDSWQNDVWQGRPVKLYIGDYSWARVSFYKIFDGITARLDCSERDKVTLVLSDKMQKLNTTVSDVKLGGSSSNKDKLIPLMFGQCFNVSPLLVDIANLEYQIHNGPIDSIIEVRDNGVPVAYTPFLSTGKFRLSQQPAGTITCSARGDAPTTYANDAVTMIKRLVKDYGLAGQRFTDSDLDLTALTAFASANTQPLGIYLTEKSNVVEVVNRIAASIGSSVLMTRAGLMTIVKIDLPQASAGTTITASDITERSLYISELPDVVAAVKLGYNKNWTVQEALQTGIPASHIEIFGQEWPLTSTQTASTTAANYKLFVDPDMTETLLQTTSVADTECIRRKDLWSVQRKVVHYEGLAHLLLEPLGGPQTVQHNRFGLSAGVRGQIINLESDWINGRVVMETLI